MFKHEKQLFHPVSVEKPNPQYAALLQEQLGGANGELKAAMQYMSQSFRIKDAEIKDLFLDIAAEELGHMEMVAQTINLLNREEAHNAMFREAFNKVQNTGSNQDFGTTKAARMYFSMSEPSGESSFSDGEKNVEAPSFK